MIVEDRLHKVFLRTIMQHFWWVSDPCHEHVMSATQIVLEPDPNHQSFDDDIFVSRQILRPWCTDFNCRVNSPLENGLLQCLTKNANFAMKLIQKLRRHRQHHFHLYVLGYIFFSRYVLGYICCRRLCTNCLATNTSALVL